MFCLHICICTMCVPDAQEGQKRTVGPPSTGAGMVIGHCMHTVN